MSCHDTVLQGTMTSQGSMIPDISVIIINYNSGHRLKTCLDHLAKQTFRAFEVIVLDNASHDSSAEDAQSSEQTAHFILSKTNLGFAAGNNKAVLTAKGRWLAFLNPDAYPDPSWLAELMAATDRYPDIEAFGSTQINADQPDRLDGAGDVYHILGIPYRGYFGWPLQNLPPEGQTFAPCAAAALYKAESFARLGGFDERFFCYCEDVDLGYRLRLAGGQVMQVRAAIVYHEGSAVTGRHSDFTIYHGHRNRIWLAYKNTPFWLYWPFLPLHILANIYLLLRAPFAKITRPYLKAIIHGYMGLGRFTADRRTIMANRKVSYAQLIKAMTWSPFKLSARKGRIWLSPPQTKRHNKK